MEAFLASFDELHGFSVARASGRPTGSVYPILARMEQAGWLESRWETEHPEPGRPRRRFYRLSAQGQTESRRVVQERRGRLPSAQTTTRPRPALGFIWRWVHA
ncbi:helix-turn-helix transcriptional regulator [Streptomyces avermitilis]|uniref:PadR family transcriptional regulator n=1 Tax=Streptomyces avermitilis TaxID=33903 RepID=UPI0033BE832D